jgi:hypothetical protein
LNRRLEAQEGTARAGSVLLSVEARGSGGPHHWDRRLKRGQEAERRTRELGRLNKCETKIVRVVPNDILPTVRVYRRVFSLDLPSFENDDSGIAVMMLFH